jgi:hypothetical protein
LFKDNDLFGEEKKRGRRKEGQGMRKEAQKKHRELRRRKGSNKFTQQLRYTYDQFYGIGVTRK